MWFEVRSGSLLDFEPKLLADSNKISDVRSGSLSKVIHVVDLAIASRHTSLPSGGGSLFLQHLPGNGFVINKS